MDWDVSAPLRTVAGARVWEQNRPVRVEANSSRPVRRWEGRKNNARADRYLSVRSTEGLFPPNRHFFAAIKDLDRTPVQPEATIALGGDHELQIHLRASEYTYFVHLITPDETARLSDNYFDLEPGESRTIVVTGEQGNLTPEMVAVRWR